MSVKRSDSVRVVEITTAQQSWFSRIGGDSGPTCAECSKEQRSPEALLITVHRLPRDRLAGWLCESCARKRNLIW